MFRLLNCRLHVIFSDNLLFARFYFCFIFFSFLLHFEIPKNFLPSFPLIILQHLLTFFFLAFPWFYFLLLRLPSSLFFFFLFSLSAPIPATSGGDRDRYWVRSGRRLASGYGGVWPVMWWSPLVSHFPLPFSFFFNSSSSFFIFFTFIIDKLLWLLYMHIHIL